MARAKTTEPMREEILEFIQKSEEAIAEAGRRLGERVSELVPDDGQSIRKVIDEAFDFTETVLKNQREFANAMLDRVLGKPAKRVTATKRAPAKSAGKRPARRPTKRAGAA
jgi:hypothetical protein